MPPTPDDRPPFDFEEMLHSLPFGMDWSTDGYGIDSCIIHDPCGTTIEQDCPRCPDCGAANPLREAGII